MLHILTQTPSLASPLMAELRDTTRQQEPDRFRANLRRLGMVMAYEISKTLPYQPADVQTPLGTATVQKLARQPVLATVLRAGLPFYEGFAEGFPQAPSGFVGAARAAFQPDHSFDIEADYLAAPSIDGQDLIVIDPMLATGKSLVRTVELLRTHGQEASLHLACVVAARPGVEYVQHALPGAHIWACALDGALNGHYYIVPGLGDAGDLAFGPKM